MLRKLNIHTTLYISIIIMLLGMMNFAVSAFADDEAEIKSLLSQYQQGYQAKNLEVIRSCFEALGTVEEAKYKNQFASMESISLSLGNISIQILTQTPRAYDAQATCDAVITYTLKGDATPRKDVQHYTFGLIQKDIQGALKEWRIRALSIDEGVMTELGSWDRNRKEITMNNILCTRNSLVWLLLAVFYLVSSFAYAQVVSNFG